MNLSIVNRYAWELLENKKASHHISFWYRQGVKN